MSKAEWTRHLDEASEKSIRWSKLEQVSLTFGDPRLGADKGPDPSYAGPHKSSKRKPEGSLEHPRREDANKRACLEKERWSKAIAQERYFREIERDQALIKKETRLLEAESTRDRLRSEHLEDQRRQGLAKLIKERRRTTKAEQQVEAAIQGLKEMTGHAERRIQEAQGVVVFWRDRYIKLAWLANQALMDIPRSLRVAEGMVHPLNTPPEITQFLELYQSLYNNLKSLSSPPQGTLGKQSMSQHRYATRSKSKAMENKVEALKQQNQDLKGEVSQLKEQMA
ncbi:hypothetical protein CR513_61154, partial [Mucuna pruriens]